MVAGGSLKRRTKEYIDTPGFQTSDSTMESAVDITCSTDALLVYRARKCHQEFAGVVL